MKIFGNLCIDIVDLSKTLSLNYKFTELKYFQVWSKNVIRLFSGLRIFLCDSYYVHETNHSRV